MPSVVCPSSDQLLAFATGGLGDKALGELELHLDTCADCRAVISNFARGDVAPMFGRYRLDTVLGSGGMGIVYRAWDPQLARAVAIKVVRRATEDEKGRARLIREAQALARLSHPHVCHVYDVGTDNEEVWVAMELIDGVSLREWAGQKREGLLEVLLGAAKGIAAAHDAGLVHRDIKPENVLVTRDGRAIVTDFGLARGDDTIDPHGSTAQPNSRLTTTGAIAGTPAYIAPEQLTGDPVDARVDQFAFGVMAWELLTGSKPFPIVFALRLEAVRLGVTPPTSMRKDVAAVLARAMTVAPRDRFASMRELIAAIEDPGSLRALVPKHRRVPAYAGLAVVAMSAAAVTAWQWPAHRPLVQTTTMPKAEPPPSLDVAAPVPDATGATTIRGAPTAALAEDPTPVRAPRTAKRGAIQAPPAPVAASTTIGVIHEHSRSDRRDAAILTMDAFCFLPYDVAHPDQDLPRPVVDWGVVKSITPETGRIMGDTITSNILTIEGARETYRVMQEVAVLNYVVPAEVGDMIAVCADGEATDLYRFPGGPTVPVQSVVPIRRAPRITAFASYRPLHTHELAFTAAGANGRPNLKLDRAYVIRARVVETGDGKRLKMDRYFLDVPPALANKLELGKPTWIVVDHLHYEAADGSGKKPFVVELVAVIGEMFPG
ncbi:hypothetical protein BH11MYX1_BH11MYX1_07110 [soil metagenome]